MARITVEDCLAHVDNRFDLVLLATKRARMLANNRATPRVPVENDKPTVLALREIAEGFITRATVEEEEEEVDLELTVERALAKELAADNRNLDD